MLVQVLVAVLMTSGGANFLVNLGNLFATDPINTRLWGIPLTVFATVAVINAINMFDGLDGLAGSLALVMLLFFAMFALADRRPERRQDPDRAGRSDRSAFCSSICPGRSAGGIERSWAMRAAWCWASQSPGFRCR